MPWLADTGAAENYNSRVLHAYTAMRMFSEGAVVALLAHYAASELKCCMQRADTSAAAHLLCCSRCWQLMKAVTRSEG